MDTGTFMLSSAAAHRPAGARLEAERQLRVAARAWGTARPKEGNDRTSIGEKEDDDALHEYRSTRVPTSTLEWQARAGATHAHS